VKHIAQPKVAALLGGYGMHAIVGLDPLAHLVQERRGPERIAMEKDTTPVDLLFNRVPPTAAHGLQRAERPVLPAREKGRLARKERRAVRKVMIENVAREARPRAFAHARRQHLQPDGPE
jgi:hypothetical protein